jgi:hypothetical protein
MIASELKEPSLYWAIDRFGEHSIAQVVDHRTDEGELISMDLVWLGNDASAELPLKNPDYAGWDFIGPFPPPRTGPKFAGFKAALQALCIAWGVELEADYAELYVHDRSESEPVCFPHLHDRTKPAKV